MYQKGDSRKHDSEHIKMRTLKGTSKICKSIFFLRKK